MTDNNKLTQTPTEDEAVVKETGASAKQAEETPAGTEARAEESDPTLKQQLEALRAENAELKDRMMRALAEAENTRRRAEQTRQDSVRYGATGLARELLAVVDNLRRALEAVPEAARADKTLSDFITGVEMTEKQFLDAFAKASIVKIAPEPGEKFDYSLHQAMTEMEDTGHPAGTVAQLLQAGYRLHDRLLRPAMVVVAKGDATSAKATENNPS